MPFIDTRIPTPKSTAISNLVTDILDPWVTARPVPEAVMSATYLDHSHSGVRTACNVLVPPVTVGHS